MQRRLTLAASPILVSLVLAIIGCGGTGAISSAAPSPSSAAPGATSPPPAAPGSTSPSSGAPGGTSAPPAGPGATPPPSAAPPSAATSSFVYVANNGSEQHVGGSISAFRVNPANGMLTPIGSPVPAGDGPSAIASDPLGQFVFVAEDHSVTGARGSNCTLFHSTILVESVNSGSGALTQVDHKSLDGACARSVTVDPSSHNVYIGMERFSDSGGEIQGFSIGPNGTLTELAGSPYLVHGLASGLAMHPTGNFVYAASDSGILVLDRDRATGALVERGAFNSPKNRLALNPNGTFLVASESSTNEISQFHVDPDSGNIEAIDFRPPAAMPVGIAADPLGKFFASTEVTDTTSLAGGVSLFVLDTATHELQKTEGSPFSSGGGTIDLAFDPSGSFLYAINRQDNTVTGFVVDRGSGKLTTVSRSATGDFPDGIVVVKGR